MFPTTRRQFAFCLGMGLFGLSERLRADVLDDLATAAMYWAPVTRTAHSPPPPFQQDADALTHWTRAENSRWHWYEREHWLDGQWQLTGITTPRDKVSGAEYDEQTGYLDESLVPDEIRQGGHHTSSDEENYAPDGDLDGQPSATRRARHGRPPSRWLRSLQASELRLWLKKINVPQAGVSGMSFWTHLTRDHGFDPELIDGLEEDEQAKLHAAAHYGY